MTNDERDKYIRESHDILTALKPMVTEHRKTLYGNGTPGIVNRITLIEAAHVECTKRRDSKTPRAANLIALAALVVAAVSVYVSLRQ